MTPEAAKSLKIFYCYAHEDQVWRDELEKHLSPLKRTRQITEWYDRQIQPGMDWKHEIDTQLATADVVLLLISADFIYSDYCWSVEMQKALERHKAGLCHIIPIILRPVSWEGTLISELQLLPTGGIAVTQWVNRDEALKDIVKGIEKVVATLTQQPHKMNEVSQVSSPIIDAQGTTEGQLAPPPEVFSFHFIWIVDCSGSMEGGKLNALNSAIQIYLPEMQKIAQLTPHVQIRVRCIKAGTGATWHIAKPTLVDKLHWRDLTASGALDLGASLSMVADQLSIPPMPSYGVPPILVLITQGYPTDDFRRGLRALLERPWGKKALRIAIGLGDDADYAGLQQFVGNPAFKVLKPQSIEDFYQCVKWVCTVPVEAISALHPRDVESVVNFPSFIFP